MLIGGFTPAVGKVYSFCKNSRILIQKHQYFYRNTFPVIFGETASNKTFTESAKDCREVSIEINGCSGASKRDEIPEKSLISPRRALAYKPLTSRRSHSSMGVLTYTSRKSSSPSPNWPACASTPSSPTTSRCSRSSARSTPTNRCPSANATT